MGGQEIMEPLKKEDSATQVRKQKLLQMVIILRLSQIKKFSFALKKDMLIFKSCNSTPW